MKATVAFNPRRAAVGDMAHQVRLTDRTGAPVRVPVINVAGDLEHAGMKPVFTALSGKGDGSYRGVIRSDMAGDWSRFIIGQGADGRAFNTQVDVPGVCAP